MQTSFDCLPCFIRQAIDASRVFALDPPLRERIVREVLSWAAEMDFNRPPAIIGGRIHRRLREITGEDDPYREAKSLQNRMALRLLPRLKEEVAGADDPLWMAARLAIAGNLIDLGVNGEFAEEDLLREVHSALSGPFAGPREAFRREVERAESILYLADNAGEIVFDGLLLDRLPPGRVTVAVRGVPVLNDATLAEAEEAGLTGRFEVIENGSDIPGTLLEECSPEFRKRFADADLILAKGQGNFETLSGREEKIIFLFKAKCAVVARRAGVEVGTSVILGTRL
ncbi:MAG: ARMT1-like domain-containing protein [Candidatus Erginobacter occultus]|nr:ARMT1-like domain-containing protein [Candidatus Erginobacter occultus]